MKRLLLLIREFGKVVRCKINEHKLMTLVSTNCSLTEKELVRMLPFKIIRELHVHTCGNTLGKSWPSMWKISMRKIAKHWNKEIEDIKIWRNILCSWIGRIHIIELSILLKAIYRFNVITIRIPTTLFAELEETIHEFIWKQSRSWIPKVILKSKIKAWGVTIPDFKTYYREVVIKTVCY